MSIRRIGSFNPFVQTPGLIQGQRRVEAVEKPIGSEDTELKTEEEALEALNAQYRAELEALEAERAEQERQSAELRAKLTLADGFESSQRELVDLKGGADVTREPAPGAEAGPSILLAQLARASAYEAAARAERAVAEPRAEVDPLQGESVAGAGDDDWMEAELSALQSELDAVDEAEEAYSDPGADGFFASLEDIENLEEGGAALGDSGADSFVASLDDIAHLVPELAAEVAGSGVVEPMAGESSGAVAEEAAVSAPVEQGGAVVEGGVAQAPVAVGPSEPAPVHGEAAVEAGARASGVVSAPGMAAVPEAAPVVSGGAEAPVSVQVQGEPSPVAAHGQEAQPVALPFDEGEPGAQG
jgi:hypothetical protein